MKVEMRCSQVGFEYSPPAQNRALLKVSDPRKVVVEVLYPVQIFSPLEKFIRWIDSKPMNGELPEVITSVLTKKIIEVGGFDSMALANRVWDLTREIKIKERWDPSLPVDPEYFYGSRKVTLQELREELTKW